MYLIECNNQKSRFKPSFLEFWVVFTVSSFVGNPVPIHGNINRDLQGRSKKNLQRGDLKRICNGGSKKDLQWGICKKDF